MSDLTKKDVEILSHYAAQGNRVLYWNYLAHKEGVDGYPALAMSVVRNDNMPGSIANHYAADMTKEVNHKELSERQWDAVGISLMKNDLQYRQYYMNQGRSDLALNLPASAVEAVHDKTFESWGITPNAWTPKLIFEAARRTHGAAEVEKVWDTMLDNSAYGGNRLKNTLVGMAYKYNDDKFPLGEYLADTTVAYTKAAGDASYEKVNQVQSCLHIKDKWYFDPKLTGGSMVEVNDQSKVRELNDARNFRIDRLEMYQDHTKHRNEHRHPDDRTDIIKSKFYISDASDILQPEIRYASNGELNQSVKSAGRQRLDSLLAASEQGDDALRVATSNLYDSAIGQQISTQASQVVNMQEQQAIEQQQQALAQQLADAPVRSGPVMKIG
jgi:hypothetical protein